MDPIRPRERFFTLTATLILLISTLLGVVNSQESHTLTLSRAPALLSKLEASLLALTGRTTRPTPSGATGGGGARAAVDIVTIPAHLQQLFESSHGNALETTNLHLPGRFTRHANTVRSFYTDEGDEGEGGPHLRFNIDGIPSGELVTGAELHVTLNTSNADKPAKDRGCKLDRIRITVNDITKRVKKGAGAGAGQEPIMYAVDTIKPGVQTPTGGEGAGVDGILSFDVFPAVQRWLAAPKANHGLWVEVKGGKNCGIRLTSPTLFTYSADAHSRRPRSADALSRKYRSVAGGAGGGGTGAGGGGRGRGRRRGGGGGHKHKNRKRNLCAKHKMFVDFTDVGWNDWIVAPPGYHAHHCAGECPFPMADHLNATNHAVIQALVNSMNPQLVPPPCCVPTKYSSLSLLYTDSSDKIVLKNYNEMVVDSCGCS